MENELKSDEEFLGYEENEINNKRKLTYNNNTESDNLTIIEPTNKKRNMSEVLETQNQSQAKDKKKMAENKYINTDKGPFYVLIDTKTPQKMISIILARTFKENNTKIKDIVEVNKKIARVEFESYEKANKCIRKDDPVHKTFMEKGYKCYIPKTYTHVEGVVRGIAGEFTMEEIKNNLTSDFPITHMEIIQTWDRTNKILKNTDILRIEIRASHLPRKVSFYNINIYTNINIPKLKFCAACLSYGHIKKYCHSKIKRCAKCTQPTIQNEHHECKEKPECKFCVGVEHYTNSKHCLEKKKQTQIQIYIIKNKTTYKEAMAVLHPRHEEPSKEINPQNYPKLKENDESTPNAWIAKANRQEAIVKEQRLMIEKLQLTINNFIQLSNRQYTEPDLLIIDLKTIAHNFQK